MERRFERQRLGLEPAPIADGLRTVDDLLDWWIENFLRNAPSYASTIATLTYLPLRIARASRDF
jgi:hypothetical protein